MIIIKLEIVILFFLRRKYFQNFIQNYTIFIKSTRRPNVDKNLQNIIMVLIKLVYIPRGLQVLIFILLK